MRKIYLKLTLILSLLACLAPIAFSGTTGKIAGKITDGVSGEGLPGANVIVFATMRNGEQERISVPRGAASDANGNYVILNVPPGRYAVRATFIGYKTVVVTDVVVSIDLTKKLDFTLEEETIQGEEVYVTAVRPVVQKDLTSSEAHVSSETIEKLPVQNLADVVQLQAGVSVDVNGAIHIRGGRSSEVQYYVDGLSVTDAFNNSSAVRVENESVQELQVISGTFNAEYGNAMSGIVNVVTKDGGDSYHGSVNFYSGDNLSSRDDLFLGVDDIDPLSFHNTQFTLSGPVPLTRKKMTFFATVRRFREDGHLNGRRMFNVFGDTLGVFDENKNPVDGEIVSMNTADVLSGQLRLAYQLSPKIKVKLGFLGNTEEHQNYEDGYRWLPDARKTNFDDGYSANFQWTQTISSKAFYNFSLSRFYKQFENYLFEDPADSRYLHPDSLVEGSFNLNNSGTQQNNYRRNTTSDLAKFDLTWQATLVHQLKFGAEYKRHELFEHAINPIPARDATGAEVVPYQPAIPDESTSNNNKYTFNPIEISAYVQDKIEYENVIINGGLRFDYFDSRGLLLADPSDPNVFNPLNDQYQALSLDQRLASWYTSPEAKVQLSPRFGISYPITDRGAIHFAYGHFLQIPNFDFLYQNPGFKVPEATGRFGIYGNSNLNPQKTVMYELGLKQQVGANIGFELTAFYRDIRDWVGSGSEIETVGTGGQIIGNRTYFTYVNEDYANVRGVTLAIGQTRSSTFNYSFDYTYQVAEGSNSDPGEEFGAIQNGGEPTRFIVPLDWDQRHLFNGVLTFLKSGYGASLITQFRSGQPYTPTTVVASRVGQNTVLNFTRNSRVRPSFLNFDLRMSKSFKAGPFDYQLTLNVYNLFDRLNELHIYTDSGRATTSSTFAQIENATIVNNSAEEFLRQPWRFSEPREIQVGLRIGF